VSRVALLSLKQRFVTIRYIQVEKLLRPRKLRSIRHASKRDIAKCCGRALT
jgi:hypothetical protein